LKVEFLENNAKEGEDVFRFLFTEPQLLGQRRTVIGQATFLAGQKNAAKRVSRIFFQ
jgi:hypothetical protein